MFCAKCGRKIKESQKFCDGCGAPNMGYKEPSEMAKIVNAAVAGDNSAIEKIYNMTYRQGYSVALQIVKNEQDAMDILQEAYISALRNLSSLQNPDKLRSWFNQIVSNRCKDWLKKKKPQLFTDMTPDDSDGEFEDTLKNENMTFSPEESVDYTETKRLMQEILDGLPEDQKLCVLMYYYEELSIAEIAETLDCSTGTVKSRLNYARKKIKIDVQELEKKGTKLYNIAPLPFILWMLRANESSVSLPADFAGKIMSNVADQVVGEVTKNVAGQMAEEAATDVAKQAAAKTAVSAGAKHLAAKIIAGVVAVSLVGGGGYAVYTRTHQPKVNQTNDNQKNTAKNDKTKKKKPTANELNALMEKIDYDYLNAMCIYLPAYDSADDLSENNLAGIYLTAMSRNFDLNYGDKYHSEDIHEGDFPLSESQIIPEDQIVSEDNQKASFKSDCFDKFNTIAGITKDPTKVDFSTVDRQNLHDIKYDGKNFTGHFEGIMDNRISSKILEKRIDEKAGAVLVSVEVLELNFNTSGEERRSQETVTIVPSDNKYGYQIKKITEDNTTLEESTESEETAESEEETEWEVSDDIRNEVANVAKAMILGKKYADGTEFNLIGSYVANDFTNDEFIQYADSFASNSKFAVSDKEEITNEYGVRDGYGISVENFKNICEYTLGRVEDYDISSNIDGDQVELNRMEFSVTYEPTITSIMHDSYGNVKVLGTITDATSADMREYPFTALGYESSDSKIGMVINQMEISE